ncbi:MAG TPA: ADOP family duplicated permease [Gemmatimonadales bacterium]|nr:ADOP family duplicated permease [Gemmatimonadales bacterium]
MLARLIRGPDAEVLRGDLEETFQLRARQDGSTLGTRIVHLGDVLASLTRWWLSGAWRRRESRANPNSGGLMRGTGTELRQLWRGLLRRPGYAAMVVLTLGLGIGATTTIYSVVDAILVRALPYPEASRLVMIGNTVPGEEWMGAGEGLQRIEPIATANLLDIGQRVSALTRPVAVTWSRWLAPDRGNGPELIPVAMVSEGFFELLGAKPGLGRFPTLSDAWSRESPSWGAMITYQGWQRRFGGDPKIIGKQINLGATFTIVGVLPRGFYQPAALVGSDAEFWMVLDPGSPRQQDRRRREVHGLAKLRPGVSLERARAELAAAQAQLVRDEPAGNLTRDGKPLGAGINSLRDATVGSAGRPVLFFLGAALLLLVLAGTNAANLLLVRGLEREGELALRRALGASRGRLTAGLVAESLSLSLAGGVVGLGVGFVGVALFHKFGPTTLPRLAEVAVNERIALASTLLSLLVGLGIGVVPGIRASGADLLANLRASLHVVTLKGTRLRTALAAVQLALALVLGIAASLLFRSFVQLRSERLGFTPANLVAFAAPLKAERPWEAWDELLDAIRAVPGVTAAAAGSNLPLQMPDWMPRVERAEQTGDAPGAGIPGYAVTPGFFAAAGIPILQGRAFDSSDQPNAAPVAIVNQTFARANFGLRSPLGERLRMLADNGPGRELVIVGVAGDVVQRRVEDGIAPALYVPHTQHFAGAQVLVVTTRELDGLAADLRRAIARTRFAAMPMLELSSMEQRLAVTQASPRFQLLLIGAFAGAALLLSAVGLYGTLAFTVRSRVKELGIRMAMGADQGMIYRLVLRQGFVVLGIGLAAGLAAALAASRLLQGFLYRVSPADPLAILVAVGVTAAAVLLAVVRPARRAARIDPMTSIRVEG